MIVGGTCCSSYYVVLRDHSKSQRRKRGIISECGRYNLMYGFNEAKDLGLNCYTTAKLQLDENQQSLKFHIGDGNSDFGFTNRPLVEGRGYSVFIVISARTSVSQ